MPVLGLGGEKTRSVGFQAHKTCVSYQKSTEWLTWLMEAKYLLC